MNPDLTVQMNMVPASVAGPWHFDTDPDPRIRAYD